MANPASIEFASNKQPSARQSQTTTKAPRFFQSKFLRRQKTKPLLPSLKSDLEQVPEWNAYSKAPQATLSPSKRMPHYTAELFGQRPIDMETLFQQRPIAFHGTCPNRPNPFTQGPFAQKHAQTVLHKDACFHSGNPRHRSILHKDTWLLCKTFAHPRNHNPKAWRAQFNFNSWHLACAIYPKGSGSSVKITLFEMWRTIQLWNLSLATTRPGTQNAAPNNVGKPGSGRQIRQRQELLRSSEASTRLLAHGNHSVASAKHATSSIPHVLRRGGCNSWCCGAGPGPTFARRKTSTDRKGERERERERERDTHRRTDRQRDRERERDRERQRETERQRDRETERQRERQRETEREREIEREKLPQRILFSEAQLGWEPFNLG